MRRKKIVLLSTHIVSDLEAIAHKVFLMKDGRFQTQGTVSELLQQANGARVGIDCAVPGG